MILAFVPRALREALADVGATRRCLVGALAVLDTMIMPLGARLDAEQALTTRARELDEVSDDVLARWRDGDLTAPEAARALRAIAHLPITGCFRR